MPTSKIKKKIYIHISLQYVLLGVTRQHPFFSHFGTEFPFRAILLLGEPPIRVWMDVWMYGRMYGLIDGWMRGLMDGWMDGLMYG